MPVNWIRAILHNISGMVVLIRLVGEKDRFYTCPVCIDTDFFIFVIKEKPFNYTQNT